MYTKSNIVVETFWLLSSKQQMRYAGLRIASLLYYLILTSTNNDWTKCDWTKCSRLMNYLLTLVTIEMDIWYQTMHHSNHGTWFYILMSTIVIKLWLESKQKQSWASSYFDKHTYSLLVSQLPCWMFWKLHQIHDYNIGCFV